MKSLCTTLESHTKGSKNHYMFHPPHPLIHEKILTNDLNATEIWMFEILHPCMHKQKKIEYSILSHMIHRVCWSSIDMSTILQACPELLQDTTVEYMYLTSKQEEKTLCRPLCNISLNAWKHTQHNFPKMLIYSIVPYICWMSRGAGHFQEKMTLCQVFSINFTTLETARTILYCLW